MVLDYLIFINDFLWNNLVLWVLLLGGIFFSVYLGLVQIKQIGKALKLLLHNKKTSQKQLSSFQALCTSLAQRVGTGNLAGVATAISAGGEGAIFWMWVTALLGGATSFAECSLAQVFKVKAKDGSFYGGPAYYIHMGLKSKTLAVIFSLFLIISMGFVLNAVQSNTIAQGLKSSFSLNSSHVGLVLAFFSGLVIFGGLKRISVVAQFLVPFMALFYLLLTAFVLVKYFTLLPDLFLRIINKAFGIESITGGVIGHGVKQAFRYGVARGLYSNEAGWGSAPNVAASAHVDHPAQQGFMQMIAVYIDTLVICSCTAVMILLAPNIDLSETGIALTQQAAFIHFGNYGTIFIAIAVMLFGFTTILGNTFYGEINIGFLSTKKRYIFIYRLLVLLMVFGGTISQVPLVWVMADIMSACMTLINMTVIIILSNIALKTLKDFSFKTKHHKKIDFCLQDIGLEITSYDLAFNKKSKIKQK